MKKIASLFLLLTVFSCSNINNINYTSSTGGVILKFDFPKKFSIKAIPNSTEKIKIKISGEGLQSSIEKIIDKNSDKVQTFKELPIGKKNIEIQAIDSKAIILAKGNKDLVIEGGKLNKAEIVLQELLETLKLNIENSPSEANFKVIEIIGSNNQVKFKEFEGNEVEIKDIPLGKADIRITAFDKNSFPLATKRTQVEVNKEVKNISLSGIKLPDLSEISEDSLQPKELFDKLDEVIIKAIPNTPPQISNISLEINGNQIINPPIVPNLSECVKVGDKINVSLKVIDENEDKLGAFWGLTSRLTNGKISFKLLDQKTTDLNYTVDFSEGNHSIGFLATDKKSYTNPLALYFKACN
ncbi:MAG: hypothetical protein U0457_06145 [Candidatus Sericytochromatia bacterium]